MDGFVNVDKPVGPSSHEVTAWVKKILKLPKSGHAGTLDPIAAGVLPVAVGKGMRLLRGLAKCDKEYVCIARFAKEPDPKELAKIFREFTGKIYQTPPKEAAVKRVLRVRRIHSLKLLEVKGKYALFRVKCQHGTYVRVLCEDVGEVLGNKCVMSELRRTMAGPFKEPGVRLQDLSPESVLPLSAGVAHLPKVVVRDKAVGAVCHGAKLARVGVLKHDVVAEGELVVLLTQKKEVIGLGTALSSDFSAKKGFVVQPRAVVMDKSAYPTHWHKKE